MSSKDRFIDFVAGGATGCQFAKMAALKSKFGPFPWEFDELPGLPSVEQVDSLYAGIFERDVYSESIVHTLLLPDVVRGRELATFVKRLLISSRFALADDVYEGGLFTDTTLVTSTFVALPVRACLHEGRNGWPMIMAPLPWMSPGRKSPVTALILKPGIVKANPYTPEDQVGIDDVDLGLKPALFARALRATRDAVPQRRSGFNQKLFRARSTVVLPKRIWDEVSSSPEV